jgi:hypothetical protein
MGLFSSLQAADLSAFTLKEDAAQYKGSDYSNAVRVERGIGLDEAIEIASKDPSIDYFMIVKGYSMVLELPPEVTFDPKSDPLGLVTHTRFRYDSGELGTGNCRIFRYGDVVFFADAARMWLSSAPGLADTYVKVTE